MKKIFFTKMQGLGKDFVVLDWEEYQELGIEPSILAKNMCKRNFGIGADGLMIVVPKSDKADLSCLFCGFNGSLAQICGDDMRCFAKYAWDKGYVDKLEFSVETTDGVILSKINSDGTVSLNIGKPILDCSKIPFNGLTNLNYEVELWSKKFCLNVLNMLSPHCVVFTNEDINVLASDYGSDIENHVLFPKKTNVEFVKVKSRSEIDLAAWERNYGESLACGTGACAAVVVGILNGLLDKSVKVNFAGGSLLVEWSGSKNNTLQDVYMTGLADFSFEGVYYYN